MPPNTRSSTLRSTGSDKQSDMRADENMGVHSSRTASVASAMGRPISRSKDPNVRSSRTALAAVSQTNVRTQKTGSTAATKASSTGRLLAAPVARAARMAVSLNTHKRVPLAPVEPAKPKVYRDLPTSSAASSSSGTHSQIPRLRRVAAAPALTSLTSKPALRPIKAVRSSSASSGAAPKYSYTSASDTERPVPLETRKRRANSVDTAAEPTRNVRPRVESQVRVVPNKEGANYRRVLDQKFEYRVPVAVRNAHTRVEPRVHVALSQERESYRRVLDHKFDYREPTVGHEIEHHRHVANKKDENDAYSTTSVESRDSQATVVDDPPHARRIVQPARGFTTRELSPFEDATQAEGATQVEEAPTAKEKHDWDDLDADDADDPMMVSEYIEDIIEYLRDAEPKYLPCTEYMSKQRALTWDMRRILVDWIIQIHYKFRMQPETLFLAINIVDRFLSKRHVAMSRLQLAGLTGLLIASKYEETTTPHIDDFIFLAGNCYTTKDVMAAEVYMLTALGFDMAYPNPMTFLRRVSKAEQYNIQTRTIAKYLLEVGLIDYRLMVFPPSHVAAAGICLARRMLRSGKWDANLRHYSGFTEEELQPCIDIMVSALLHAKESEFVFKKYTHRRFLRASLFCQDWVARHSDEFDLADLHIRTFVAASAAAADSDATSEGEGFYGTSPFHEPIRLSASSSSQA